MDPQQMNNDELQTALGMAYLAKAKAEEDFDELKREWRKRHGNNVGNEREARGIQTFLSPNKRWDEGTARKVLAESGLSERMIAKLETTTIDRKKAEEQLPPNLYNMCQKEAAPKFNVRFTG